VVAPTVHGPPPRLDGRGGRSDGGDSDIHWERALLRRPLPWLGAISYSVYVWHQPLLIQLSRLHLVFSQVPAAFWWNAGALLMLGIYVGWLSYCYLERPWLATRPLSREQPQEVPTMRSTPDK
jgi:peptidoglycan/LPS O-acetylase OafA/YrhL